MSTPGKRMAAEMAENLKMQAALAPETAEQGIHYRSLHLPKCNVAKCSEIATDEIWDGDVRVGQYCPEHSVKTFRELRRERV